MRTEDQNFSPNPWYTKVSKSVIAFLLGLVKISFGFANLRLGLNSWFLGLVLILYSKTKSAINRD